jgi:hypothetical protein
MKSNFITNEAKEIRKEKLIGGELQMDTNDKHVHELLFDHLPRLLTGDGDHFVIDEIQQITRQVVAGVLYKVKGHSFVEGQKKFCTISLLERGWLKTEKIIISAMCDDGSCYVSESYTCPLHHLMF